MFDPKYKSNKNLELIRKTTSVEKDECAFVGYFMFALFLFHLFALMTFLYFFLYAVFFVER